MHQRSAQQMLTTETVHTSQLCKPTLHQLEWQPLQTAQHAYAGEYYNVLPSQTTNITISAPAPAMQDTEVKKHQQVEPIQPRPQQQVKPIQQEPIQPRTAHHQHFGPCSMVVAATALATQEKITTHEKITMACWKLISPGTFLDDLPLEILETNLLQEDAKYAHDQAHSKDQNLDPKPANTNAPQQHSNKPQVSICAHQIEQHKKMSRYTQLHSRHRSKKQEDGGKEEGRSRSTASTHNPKQAAWNYLLPAKSRIPSKYTNNHLPLLVVRPNNSAQLLLRIQCYNIHEPQDVRKGRSNDHVGKSPNYGFHNQKNCPQTLKPDIK
ncbi:hypothetical protein M758_UG183300 [Ceratodon purpureus]|nr:hypothetical protein M758_UG183300 [Ceratodon purpureus]